MLGRVVAEAAIRPAMKTPIGDPITLQAIQAQPQRAVAGLLVHGGGSATIRQRRKLTAQQWAVDGPGSERGAWRLLGHGCCARLSCRSEEPTSELQSLMRISYAVF